MISLADAKAYIRVDYDDEDLMIERLIAAAGNHLKSIGVNMDADPLPPSVELAQLLLVGHFFDNRDATGATTTSAIDFGVDRLIAPHREQGI
ncbi:phage gp6-like head-tail connector protein [Agrobacterium vitis]|uniref:Phage gp6-like head-tail connector protein n=1 Tax=Agrobacterium vitis TaxID=373 RepID=A0A368NWJ6_AGRVI|nr:head-tail connector protein [Agrobacterium vitis]KAA3514811.1 phage gp6-like head-tail connector protein [Agrobacterium vitis]KAA3528393.1 phage gp6-like head-tail connector protein [Agrobacterium vitis]MCF1477845.1 phage gp6-like head-tail connector protein [Agrobacterium vitis]MUZ98088.1 phage gp6-like head-tail connector protein [Agrobacterium vitis]MVA31010.1 phage gp6-like head-tail connector protein [Agrobacterium vitis]